MLVGRLGVAEDHSSSPAGRRLPAADLSLSLSLSLSLYPYIYIYIYIYMYLFIDLLVSIFLLLPARSAKEM